jgi:xyloglucan-specific endo-beta-1,4-glucanase
MKFSLLTTLASLATLTMAQTQLCDQYGYYASNGYYFNNNRWGQGSGQGDQCLLVFNTAGGGVSWQADWTWSGGQDNVKSYPYSGREFTPKLINSIGSLPSAAQWTYQGNNIRANVAYDLFTASDPNHDKSSGDYELMVWLGRYGNVYPIGSSKGNVNVLGQTWELFDGYNGAMRVFSFVAPSQRGSFSGDLKAFYNHLIQNNGFPGGSQYLITNQFGTEPFTGGPATFQVQNWNAQVN